MFLYVADYLSSDSRTEKLAVIYIEYLVYEDYLFPDSTNPFYKGFTHQLLERAR